jgi:hypothetical protein
MWDSIVKWAMMPGTLAGQVAGLIGIITLIAICLKYGTKCVLYLDLMFRTMVWVARQNKWDIPSDLANRYKQINGNAKDPIHHKAKGAGE